MKILLVYPRYPESFWSFKYALKFISKKAAAPPLGLITVSAMLPLNWEKRLVDMNVTELKLNDLEWADYVFISAMYIQKKSVNLLINKCLRLNKKIVAGGPLFTQDYKSYPQIDHLVLNEAEITLPLFLNDLANGIAKKIYKTDEYADISQTPIPEYHLLDRKKYALMNIQVSRGCPFSCNFCEIPTLLGHKVRTKEANQIRKELDRLYELNWKGIVFIVDDNFIGDKKTVKEKLLPDMKNWMQNHKYPFSFNTETSINLADDDELINLMVDTGFSSVFVGIETPDEISLQHCNKKQNKNRDLVDSVEKLQKSGLVVSGGFIVGFDSDTPSVFQRQIDFIQKSGIVTAMVGLLNAPKDTKLYKQLKKEKRLTSEASGNNTDLLINFIPKMDYQKLINGYRKILNGIYRTKPFYQRLRVLMRNYNKKNIQQVQINSSILKAFVKLSFVLGFINKGRFEYWKLIVWVIINKPRVLVDALVLSAYGYHFRKVYGIRS